MLPNSPMFRMLALLAGSATSGLGFLSFLCSDLDLVNLQAEVQGTVEARNLGPCRVQQSNCLANPSSEMEYFIRF